MTSLSSERPFVVAAMYHFVQLDDYVPLRDLLYDLCLANSIKGTLLLAKEGLNGTLAGPREGIDELLAYLRSDPRLADLHHNESYSAEPPFLRLKVKLKSEIVTMGIANTNPAELTGTRVSAEQWNALIQDPDVLVIDTRNRYECGIGTFENAISPETENFREFPEFVKQCLDPERDQKIAMFCTGGIRCEKASNYLLREGFADVFHLDGGILQYLEDVAPDNSLWHGECFVFDDRVAVDKNLTPGTYTQCTACRRPLSAEDRSSPQYQLGISCPYCAASVSEEKRVRLAERKRQQEWVAQRLTAGPAAVAPVQSHTEDSERDV